MLVAELEQVLSLMKQYGVTHLKGFDSEITMVDSSSISPVQMLKTEEKPNTIPLQAVPPVDMKIVHHVNEVANLLKLSDEDLVDKLFPDYSQLPAKAEGE